MHRRSRKGTRRGPPRDDRLYTLEVYLISGPIAPEFAKKIRVISRTIQIRGHQSLRELHRAIFRGFDQEEEHMYEFQIGRKGPHDPKARRYVLPVAMEDPFGEGKPAGDVTCTPVGSLGLRARQAFGYWFDFGDNWWHQINVVAIEDGVPAGKYPEMTKRVGESPPQYADWDADGK